MHSRRDVLRTGRGIAGAGVLSALAGCGTVPYGETAADEGLDHAAWIYDPNALDSVSMSVTVTDVATVLAADDVSDTEGFREDVTGTYGEALAADDVDSVFTVGYAEVLTGSFDPVEVLERADASPTDGYGEFDVYADETAANRLLATDGDALVASSPPTVVDFDARAELELLLDTAAGDADRFLEVNDDFRRVHEEIDPGTYVSVNGRTASSIDPAEEAPLVASATSLEIDGATVAGRFVFRYADESGIDLDRIESDLENSNENVTLGEVSQDGRTVTAEFTLPTEQFL